MRVTILSIMILAVLSSCGSSGETSRACSTNTDDFKKTWTQQSTGLSYDMTSCGVATTCRLCISNFCNSMDDIDIFFVSGGIDINYFNVPNVMNASWQICDGTLEIYNFNNGAPTEYFN